MPSFDFDKIVKELLYSPREPMIFTSGSFVVIFGLFLIFYKFVVTNRKSRMVYLLLFSLYFYYKSSGMYFLFLFVTATIDYTVAIWMEKITDTKRRRILLLISLISNLGLLGYFKYMNFFLSTANGMFGKDFAHLDIFLPAGISFYTFQSLSYTIDVYRRVIKSKKNFFDFAFFVSFFPQLVAGPIVRAKDFLPQLDKDNQITPTDTGMAILLIMKGLIKKAIIADYISTNFVDRVFDSPLQHSGLENLLGVYGYAMQIYCDFSGYSDMAIGIAMMLGYRLTLNFNSPYKATSLTDFWHRWHISLSSWLRDYLYISLGGNRKGKIRTYFNLMMTMLLGGLWHGASWKFVMWGGLHGGGLAFEKALGIDKIAERNVLTRWIGRIITFHFVCLGWLFFRADSFDTAIAMLVNITTAFHLEILWRVVAAYNFVFILIAIGYIVHYLSSSWNEWFIAKAIRTPKPVIAFMLVVVIWVVFQVKTSEIQPFIYFQF